MKKLYLANPLGFMELATPGLENLIEIITPYFDVIEPFSSSVDLGKEIGEIITELTNGTSSHTYKDLKQNLKEINFKIGQRNMESIQNCDYIFAILDGSDVDSGVAAEIGYGFGLHKTIYGFRSDLRQTGDNLGAEINLQLQFFIESSGGTLFRSINGLKLWLKTLDGKNKNF